MNIVFISLFLIVLIFIIYVVYLFNRSTIAPYSKQSLWSNIGSKVEGMTIMDMMGSNTDDAKPVESTTTAYNKQDVFGLIDSSMTCEGNSYSNIGGNICLNPEQRRLLTTRGGNAEIGGTSVL